jgi:hypothetical protein
MGSSCGQRTGLITVDQADPSGSCGTDAGWGAAGGCSLQEADTPAEWEKHCGPVCVCLHTCVVCTHMCLCLFRDLCVHAWMHVQLCDCV